MPSHPTLVHPTLVPSSYEGATLLLACHYGDTSVFNTVQTFITTHIGIYGGPDPGSVHSSLVLIPVGIGGCPLQPLGLQAVPLRLGPYTPDVLSPHVRYYDTGLDAVAIADVWEWALTQVGGLYDFVGLGLILSFEIEHRLGLRPDVTRAFLSSPRATFFCSAFAVTALKRQLPLLAPFRAAVDSAPAWLEQEAIRTGLKRWRATNLL